MASCSPPGSAKNSVDGACAHREKLAWLGVVLDPAANAGGKAADLATAKPRRRLCDPTDEESMIARHTLALISAHRRPGSARAMA